jgi:hypothetical protein
MEEKDVDMTEVFGVTVRRKEKLMLVPIAKLRATSGHSKQAAAAEDTSMAMLK